MVSTTTELCAEDASAVFNELEKINKSINAHASVVTTRQNMRILSVFVFISFCIFLLYDKTVSKVNTFGEFAEKIFRFFRENTQNPAIFLRENNYIIYIMKRKVFYELR